MQTQISKKFLDTPSGQTADRILRNCVHCGFCTATCPTYQLLGDELDGPRGRIYLIKQLLEGNKATSKTRQHLDRCLTCRNCETTCPSGVDYSHLLDIGRSVVHEQTRRSLYETLLRKALLWALPNPQRFSSLIKLGKLFSFILPASLKKAFPDNTQLPAWPSQPHKRKILLLEGCVQPSLAPEINHATASLLNKLGIETIRVKQTCCGALAHHLTEEQKALSTIKQNIDTWWPYIDEGIEAIISNASGCGVMVKDYAYLLKDDPQYSKKAETVSSLTRDISELIQQESLPNISNSNNIGVHIPCTLQHGQKLSGITETVLKSAGFNILDHKDKHLCCGSAGTYSITQKKLSQRLLNNKLDNLMENEPDVIVTGNIGCLLHLRSQSPVPVMHWVELMDRELS
ncbi:MAG: glycolate oxidase subunit GlcF [Gammaproteobacteria bacterium]|nr:glycolate oxidase subunit GlcF [Gammaproteobacteria bacterium]